MLNIKVEITNEAVEVSQSMQGDTPELMNELSYAVASVCLRTLPIDEMSRDDLLNFMATFSYSVLCLLENRENELITSANSICIPKEVSNVLNELRKQNNKEGE